MRPSRSLVLGAVLALATAAVAVAGLRPRATRTKVAVELARAESPPSTTRRAARRNASTVAPAVVASAPTAARRPVSRVRAEASRFRREGAADPHSLQVITVPVPGRYAGKRVDYAVTPSGTADLLSAHDGTLPATATPTPRATTIVTRVPAGATAGPLEVATVDFSDDSSTTTVAVELTVARIRRITLRPLRATTAVYPGQKAQIVLIALNLGNSPDTLRLQVDPISGWRVDHPPALVLQPGEQQNIELNVRTPPPPASGFVPLTLRARADTGTIASVLLPVELLPDDAEGLRARGPVVTAGMATAVGDAFGSSPVLAFSVNGPLTDRISLRGRLTQTTDRADYNVYAMGRVGYYIDNSFLNATGHGWSVTGGRTGMGFAPVLGWNAYGLGTSAELSRGGWSLGLLAVQEKFGAVVGAPQLGARLSRGTAHGTWSLTATHLKQQILFDRALDAAGIGYEVEKPSLALSVDAGYRSSTAASGVAGDFRIAAHSPRQQFLLSASHAPGGSGAFARATNEVNGSAFRRFTPRLILRAFGYGSSDEPGTGSTSNTRGGGFGPSVMVGRRSNLDLSLSSTRSEFQSVTGTVVSTDRMATLGARTIFHDIGLRGSVGAGQLTRNTAISLGPTFDRTGRRLVVNAAAEKQTAVGSFSLEANMEQNDATTGQVPRISSLVLQASRLRPFPGPHAPVFAATVWTNSYPGAPSLGPAARVSADLQLPGQFALMIDAERNPYLRGDGRAPIIAAIRFERSIGIPGIRHPTTQGQVFDDRNGNGIRDDDEPGLGGVLVRRGVQSMTTRPDGTFRFYEPAAPNAAPAVDVGSLEVGQIAPSPNAATGRTWALPVTRTARLRIQVVPTADSLGRVPLTKPSVPTVVATDSTGAVWVAHPDSTGWTTFDALPAGEYTLTIDFTGSTERLRMLESPPVVRVTTAEAPEPVKIPFGFRPVRVFDGGSTSGGRRRK